MNCSKSRLGHSLVLGTISLRCAFVALRNEFVFFIQQESVSEYYIEVLIFIMIALLRVCTSESMIPRPYFQTPNHRLFTVLLHVYLLPSLLALSQFTIIHITCVLLSLRR